MNDSQMMFYNFILERTQIGKEAEMEVLLEECFAKQDSRKQTLQDMQEFIPKMLALLRLGCVEEVRKIMSSFYPEEHY
ncbi:MAG: hypothetical protein LBB79_00235 [Prevotellaceae bacterium]|jgi:hypothetical protein|nr:hypothetical protein [Prevotellaceae bacterium]